MLLDTETQAVEDISVGYLDIIARHRVNVGMNTEFEVKLTPKGDKAAHSQNLSLPIHLQKGRIVQLVLMHKYGIITTLSFSEYASDIFAQKNRKLGHLLDFRKISSQIADDYNNNNHPVSSLSDATQHLAGKSIFSKLDCCQACPCFLMADQRSMEMLAFIFEGNNFV